MRIELVTIEDFCAELSTEATAGRIYEGIVRVRTDRMPEQEEAISFEVGFWATALVKSGDGDWVLEFGRAAGRDTAGNPDGGTKQAAEWKKQIEAVCEAHDLTLRRGRIEVW